MAPDIVRWGSLVGNTLLLRPYVFLFLLAFFAAAARDLGLRRSVGFFLWGWSVAFVAEYASTRVGVPFGLYHYTGATVGLELYLANVPLFDSISFPFLAYASFCLARRVLGDRSHAPVVFLAGILMMLLDVVIDPLAVRGDRWFLGRIFFYPAGGAYFGVPLSNFAGWAVVGWVTVGGYVRATERQHSGPPAPRQSPGAGVALYYGIILFNLALTLWIGEWGLLAAGSLVHLGGFLLLYAVSVALTSRRVRTQPFAESTVWRARPPSH